MDWSTNLGKLFQARQTIATSTNKAEVEKAKKEEKDLLSNSKLFDLNNDNKVDIDDLVSFSTLNKDKDNDGKITEEETSIFNSIKNTLYDKLAKDVNKNDNLKVGDMLNLEEKIRELNNEQKETIGNEMEKLQNRMVSNLTAQFFVTKETASYKENSKNGMLEIWEAQAGLEDLNDKSGNNPFNNKLEVLLDKLESRVTRTLAEDYTAASIKDAKNSGNISMLVKKTGEVDEDLDLSKFTFDGTTLKYDGEVYTGTYSEKWYEDGKLLTGISLKNGKYYIKGLPADGVQDFTNTSGDVIGACFVKNGKIEYADLIDSPQGNNTVRKYYESYMTHEKIDGIWKDNEPSVIKKVVTFIGTVETGKDDETGKISKIENYEKGVLVSTDTYEYNSDGSFSVKREFVDTKKDDVITKYTTTGELFEGNGVYDGKFYEDYKLVTGPYGGRYYVAGVMPKGFLQGIDGVMYFNGEKLTGICASNGKYYEDGLIKELATAKDGKVYSYGVLANGVIKEADNTYSYYIAGVKQSSVEKELAEFILAPENNIQNVRFWLNENGSVDFTKFTGVQYLEYAWRDVEYEFTSKDDYTQVVTYAKNQAGEGDIKYSCKFVGGKLNDAKYILGTGANAVTVDVKEDGSKVGIDYSINFVDIDGSHPAVTISNAAADGITYVTEYILDEIEGSETKGKYVAQPTKFVLASINEIQTGKAVTAYDLGEKVILDTTKKDENDNQLFVITDTRIDKVTAEQTFGSNGKLVEGVITFSEPAEGANATITLGVNASYKVDTENGRIIVTELNNNGTTFIITTYNNDGSVVGEPRKIPNNDGTAQAFAKTININLNDIEDIEIRDGKVKKVTINGVEYNVSENTQEKTTIIKSVAEEGKESEYEKQFKTVGEGENAKVITIYEKSPFGNNSVEIKRNDNGVQTFYKSTAENGNFSQYEYDAETGKVAKATFGKYETKGEGDSAVTTFKQKEKSYASDGKTVIDTKVSEFAVTQENNKEVKTLTSETVYAGKEDDNKITYKKYEISAAGYKEDNYSATTGKLVDRTIVTNATGTEPKTETRYDFKADGETVATRTVTAGNEINKFEVNSKEEGDIATGGILTEKTVLGEEKSKTVTKYSYSAVSNAVTLRTVEKYDNNGIITEAQTFDGAEDDTTAKLQSEIEYVNGIKSKEIKYTYNDDGSEKVITIQEYDGSFVTKVIVRTYNADGTYTERVGSAEDRFDANGNLITKEQLQFAASLTPELNITDVEYDEDGNLVKIIGTRFNQTAVDARKSTFSDWSVSADGKYTYTEEVILAENGAGAADNVVFRLRVEDDEQKSAKIVIDGKSYNVNVNGAELNGNIDTSISTWKADENATKIYVADALFDGITRQRLFNKSGEHYTLSQTIAIGTIEDVQTAEKASTTPKIEIPDGSDIAISKDGNTVTLPSVDNKINIHLGSSAVAYSIELQENETFTIAKNGKITSQYTDSNNKVVITTYTFNEDGGYTKTSANGVGITYSPVRDDSDNVTSMKISAVKIGEFSAEAGTGTTITENEGLVTVNRSYDAANDLLGLEVSYYINNSENHNIGDLETATIKFSGNKSYTLKENETFTFNEDGDECIISSVAAGINVRETYDKTGALKTLKLGNSNVDIPSGANVTYYTDSTDTEKYRTAEVTFGTSPVNKLVFDMSNGNAVKSGTVYNQTIEAGSTVTFNRKSDGTVESMTVKKNGADISVIYNTDGSNAGIIIDNVTLTGSIKLYKQNGTETSSMAEASYAIIANGTEYEIKYDLATKTVETAKYGTTSFNEFINDFEVLTTLDGINMFFSAIKELGSEIDPSKIKNQDIEIQDGAVCFTYNNNNKDNKYIVNMNNSNKIVSYTVRLEENKALNASLTGLTEAFEQAGVTCTPSGTEENRTYDLSYSENLFITTDTVKVKESDTTTVNKYFIMDGITFMLPSAADITMGFDSTAKDGTIIIKASVGNSYVEFTSDKENANAVVFTLSKIVQNGNELPLANYESKNTIVIKEDGSVEGRNLKTSN